MSGARRRRVVDEELHAALAAPRIGAQVAGDVERTPRGAEQPDEGGHYLLVQLLGVAKTMEFLMRKRIVSGEEALELGLVHEAVEPERLMEVVERHLSEAS